MSANKPGDSTHFKQLAAQAALAYVQEGMLLGLGSGSTMAIFTRLLGEELKSGRLSGIAVAPTSLQAARLAAEYAIPTTSLAAHPRLDLALDGADEVDPRLNVIKGMGRALLWEKIIAIHAEQFIVVVDESKMVEVLGGRSPLPVEIIPFEAEAHIRWLSGLGCRAELWLDSGGHPYETDNHNYMALCWFDRRTPGGIPDPYTLAQEIKLRPGIVEHGLFLDLADLVIIAGPAGVRLLERPR